MARAPGHGPAGSGGAILLEPDGSAVVLRTPLYRAARFGSLADAEAWIAGQHGQTVPPLAAGLAAVVAKVLLPDGVFLVLLLPILAAGGAGTLWYARRYPTPKPTWLSWEESVRLDDRRHPPVLILRDLGVAAMCGALLALVAVLVRDGGLRNLASEGPVAMLLALVFTVGLGLGLAVGVGSAIRRARYWRAKLY